MTASDVPARLAAITGGADALPHFRRLMDEGRCLCSSAHTAWEVLDALLDECDRLRAAVARGLALADAIHGDNGVMHNDGCEGEPDCLACIEADLRAVLASSTPDTNTQGGAK